MAIDVNEQERIFIAIGNLLNKKITAYAIGGTAMILLGMKSFTLDIDIVFDKKDDREEFADALRKFRAKESDATLVYGLKDNIPVMLELEGTRFDLFTTKIINMTFSENMKNRAIQTHEFGKNLIIKVADPHDIIIMKSVTSRAKDMEDIIAIINKTRMNWDILVEEAGEQVALGKENAVLSLGEKLEKLNNNKLASVPKGVLDKLWNLLEKQIDKKRKKGK